MPDPKNAGVFLDNVTSHQTCKIGGFSSMDMTIIITSAAVGAIVAALINLIGQYFERRSRRKELLLSKAVEMAIERARFTFDVAKASNACADIPDQAVMAATYYQWLKHLLDRDELPPNVNIQASETDRRNSDVS